MPDTPPTGTDVVPVKELSAELVATFSQMAMIIPEGDDNAMEQIMLAVLAAGSWEQLSDPWETDNAERLAGKTLLIERVTRHPSDIAGGLGIFLVAHGTDMRSGEKVVFSTGSLGVMAQLVRAHTAGWLPLFAQLVIAERATKDGFRPQHLKFVGQPKQAPAEDKTPETVPF
jgi:hypothetical protein